MIYQRLQEISQDLLEEGYKEKYESRLYILMKACAKDTPYAATKTMLLLNDVLYAKSKKVLLENGAWGSRFQALEAELKGIKLELV